MSDTKAHYLTTTLPYVNADPHIGFAFELVTADAITRYWRLMYGAENVFFNTGTDEHGQKIAQKADEAGKDRQAYVDHFAGEFNRLKEGLSLSYDAFIRTTNPEHKVAVQEMWRRCAEQGDIYKKKYSGLYCVGCESFKTEADLVDGKCPDHNKAPELVEEENYFFKLSNYQAYLEEYLSRPGVILPEWRRLEALNFVKGGLEDFSISREKARLDWGVPVPGDDEQVMYVWFDALTNYISTLGWPAEEGNFGRFWRDGNVVQVAGKDQVRFQSIMWQAMLKSAGVKATDQVVYHGFINSGGQKMSKSIGNVISPYELIARYGTEATRYILLRHVHPFDDSDLTWEKMDEYYTANLVNGLGNLVARVMKMAETYGVTYKEYIGTGEIADNFHSYPGVWDVNWGLYNLQGVLDELWKKIGALDVYIQREEPFKKIKVHEQEAKNDVAYLLSHLLRISYELEPLMPYTSGVIRNSVLTNTKPENLFTRLPLVAEPSEYGLKGGDVKLSVDKKG